MRDATRKTIEMRDTSKAGNSTKNPITPITGSDEDDDTLSMRTSRYSTMRSGITQYIRTIFLEIVRVRYWHQIHEGKIPRLSFSAQFLLYTIDVGLDNVEKLTVTDDDTYRGTSVDWQRLEQEISIGGSRLMRAIVFLDNIFHKYFESRYFKSWINWA